jgi:hypothetical protein
LADLVAPGGRLLLVVPAPVLDYPLFTAACSGTPGARPTRWLCGNAVTSLAGRGDHCVVPAGDREGSVADRWMSLLSKFTDTEPAAGTAEINARYEGPELEFEDSFVFIAARRAANGSGVRPGRGLHCRRPAARKASQSSVPAAGSSEST